jgi:FtsP/CotA-like multicopper oxidase with cupredoxin domain
MAQTDGSLDRRGFLEGCAAVATCGIAASTGMAGSSPAPAEVDLEAREAVVDIAGVRARLFTYNGVFPGPLIRAREGERFRVRLTNRLTEPTNLHFHGLHVSPADNHDNVFVNVQPGETFVYELTVPAGYGGTFWYHPHRHGQLARQLWHGLAGPLLVDPVSPPEALAGIEEQVVVIKDISIAGGRPDPHRAADWARGKSGEIVLVNGQVRPQIQTQDSLVRLRLINACNARMLLLARADGAPLQVIARDGHLLEAPQLREEMLLTPAQRLDLLLALDGSGPVELLHKPYNRGAQREPSRPEPLFSVRPGVRSAPRRPLSSWRRSSGSTRKMSRFAAASGWPWLFLPRMAKVSWRRSRRAWAISSSGRSRTSTLRTTCSTCTPGHSRSGAGTASP